MPSQGGGSSLRGRRPGPAVGQPDGVVSRTLQEPESRGAGGFRAPHVERAWDRLVEKVTSSQHHLTGDQRVYKRT